MSGFIVVCTDRGRHKPRHLSKVRVLDDGTRHMTIGDGWKSWAPPDETVNLYRFACPDCRRNPQLRPDTWWALVEKTLELGVPSLDLSKMPL